MRTEPSGLTDPEARDRGFFGSIENYAGSFRQFEIKMAGATGLEPAAPCVTGRYTRRPRQTQHACRPRPSLRLWIRHESCAIGFGDDVTQGTSAWRPSLHWSSQTQTTSASPKLFTKRSRTPSALTFPDTSLFIQVVRKLERKIDERLRSSTSRIVAS